MNAQLLNPFTVDIPDSVSTTLETAECTTCLFNHGSNPFAGQYLAVGRNDGYITIWDLETKAVLRLLNGHVRSVTGLAWSEGNRYLASCSADWNVIVWDLSAKSYSGGGGGGLRARDGNGRTRSDEIVGEEELREEGEDTRLAFGSERKKTIRFDCAVTSVQFAPGDSRKLVVVLASQQAYLVKLEDQIRIRKKRKGDQSSLEVESITSSPIRIPLLSSSTSTEASNDDDITTTSPLNITAARFTPDSTFIIAGTSKGHLLTFLSSTGTHISTSTSLSTTSSIKEISFDPSNRYLLVNCSDRSLRLLSISTFSSTSLSLTLLSRVSDMIQRTSWINLGFSPSSDYIFAGAAHKSSHNIYIWDRSSTTLIKILEGPKDWLIGVDWHPTRPILASVSNTGTVYIWFNPTEEIWSSYAPGFEELEENIEYEEKENEFDIESTREKDEKRRFQEESDLIRVDEFKKGREGGEINTESIAGLLDLNEKHRKMLEMVIRKSEKLESDSGWLESEEKGEKGWEEEEKEEIRELIFTIADNDSTDYFVIPPRLETDYSDFHDEHN